ncbi:cytochrome p450 83b1 [Phtheirospermum japonicum]|uniref:Cytochrome p450 83b1 n=1 Tax=Phtheirospermum japonicum TaxID=374723 RepID=A0A830BEB7_9LAMI|nr:cytochrome p450 83b1 [Phtheirospermum japonicum]
MILHLFLLSLPLIFFLYHLQKNKKPINSLVPPGPPGLPIIGNIHQLAAVKTPYVYLWQLSQKYGPLIHLKLGSKPLIVVSNARLAKEVLKTHDLAFCSRPKSLAQQKLTYNGSDIIFSPYNDYWREVRKITVMNLFSVKKLQSFRPIREDEMSRLMAKISGRASANQAVDLSETSISLGSTFICRIAFGKRYDEQGSEMQRFDKLLHEISALGAGVYASDYFPRLGYWVDKFTGSISRIDTTFKKLELFYQELIDEKIRSNKKVDEEDGDILDVLIQLKDQKAFSVDFTWDNIKALLLDIFVAGSDTSSSAIVWTMTALIKNPEIMKRAQAEVRNLVGDKGKVDEDDLPKLPYLKAIINETLRLYPPIPILLPRETIEKCTLDGYEIQPKTLVYVNAWAVSRDPEYWGNNSHEFLPERFLNSDIDVKGHDFGVLPFGAGRRACPGMSMGLANLELTVASLLYSFDWELPQGVQAKDVDTEALFGLAVHKKNPLLLVPKKYVV